MQGHARADGDLRGFIDAGLTVVINDNGAGRPATPG